MIRISSVRLGEEGEMGRLTGWSAGNEDLYPYTNEVHVPKRTAPKPHCRRFTPYPQRSRNCERCSKVNYPVRDPCHDVQERGGVASEDIADVGSVEDGFESREDGYPDVWSVG